MFPTSEDDGEKNEKKTSYFGSISTKVTPSVHDESAKLRKERHTISKNKKSQRPFLTSSQLSDLFCRLDRNGDGELDLDEFTGIIRMLKLDVDEDFISTVFRAVDSANTGVIEMQEFICAYQKIYCKHDSTRDTIQNNLVGDEFIRVTRYGADEHGDRVFELYMLSNDPKCAPNKKTTFHFDPVEKCMRNSGTSALRNIHHQQTSAVFSDYFDKCTTELFPGNLEDLNKLMVIDNKRNFDTDSRLMWWVDISMKNVERSKVNKYVDIFGLPNNSKFLSSFGNFGNALPKDPKSRIFIGNGVTVEGNVTSCSVFNQAITILDTPVVHHLPSWIENRLVSSSKPTIIDYIARYYTTRFAFLFNLTGLSDTRRNEKCSAYESAAAIVQRFRGDLIMDSDDSDNEEDSSNKSDAEMKTDNTSSDGGGRNNNGKGNLMNILPSISPPKPAEKVNYTRRESIGGKALRNNSNATAAGFINAQTPQKAPQQAPQVDYTRANSNFNPRKHSNKIYNNTGKSGKKGDDFSILRSRGSAVTVMRRKKHKTPPTWTLSNGQLAKRPPIVKFDTFSMHILENQNRGANCIVTIRRMDDEHPKFATMEAKSRSGVLGRIFDGVWMKLLQVVGVDGSADVAGELDDSPATLMSFLQTLIHSYSMRSLGTIDSWMATIEKEVRDVVVSKHSSHIKELERVIKECSGYVDPICSIHADFIADWERESAIKLADEAEAAQAAQREREHSNSVNNNNSRDPRERSQSSDGESRNNSPERKEVRTPTLPRNRRTSQPTNLKSARLSMIHSTSRGSLRELIPYAALPPPATLNNSSTDVEHLPLSYRLIKRFYNFSIYRDLKIVVEGYELLDMKGLHYWKERLDKYAQRVSDVKELITTQQDEKRNFTSFTLTIVTTLLAPLAVLTGYFGMNFDNMEELHVDTYRSAPGVYLMWYLIAFAYGCLLVLAIHYRIIYSAT